MLITDAITVLRDATLKQVQVGDDNMSIINYMNIGILEIHKRFRLMQGEATITVVDGVSTYRLDGTDANVAMDLSSSEVLVVECVLDEDGEEVSLNKLIDPKSTRMLSVDTIRIGEEETSATYKVIYRASPAFVFDDQAKIPLSLVFLEALFHYVGFQAYLSVTGDENSQHALHKKRFEESIERVRINGLCTQNDLTSNGLEQKGLVL